MGSGSSKNRTKNVEIRTKSTCTEKKPAESGDKEDIKMFKAYKEESKKCDLRAEGADDKNKSERADVLPWRHVLDKVAGMEIWGGVSRNEREPWKQYFQKADDIMKKPRKRILKEVVDQILEGDMSSVDISRVPNAQPKVVVFVSSTFTDTKAERNHLMKDVYPFLRSLCRRLGVDFGTVDMRWGVTEDATLDHSTVDMCVSEIHRCINDSVGPAFLCLLGHKYGYRPLPAQIEESEFETLFNHVKQKGEDMTKLENYYTLDNNAVPPHFVLKPRTKENKTWWPDVEFIQGQLRDASIACFGANDKKCDKYHISVTETEIHSGVFENPNAGNQASFVRRDLDNYMSDFHKDRKIIDLVKENIDTYAQEKMSDLREKKIPSNTTPGTVLDTKYDECLPDRVAEKIKHICDHVCKTLADKILEDYETKLHVEEDRVFLEALQHRDHGKEKSSLFVGREMEIKEISEYLRSGSTKPLVVHGQSGCGKTALMAVAAKKAKDTFTEAVVVLRFLGTTGQSASARLLLLNVCAQIARAYNQDVSAIPTSYKDLIKYFQTCLGFASSNKPLIVFLDSLDQLSNEDLGQNLAWLSLSGELPPHTKLVVSSLPTKCLDILRSNLKDGTFIEVRPLSLDEGPEVLKKMLEAKNRRVTASQQAVIMEAFKKCPLPLFLRLVADIAVRWKSFKSIDSGELADDMPGLITKLFHRLETRFGELFVQHALAYITASKNGLSLAELEDILSCDDEVLDSIFQWWVPPIRRIPPLLWARVRNELGMYLAEKGTDGISAYSWYHRQFWETAEKRYLKTPFTPGMDTFEKDAHNAIAEYFEGKWEIGKPHENKDGKMQLEDRKIPKQPLVVSGERIEGVKRQLNRRKLSELPYHLIRLGDWERFRRLVLDLPYIEAKFEAADGYACLSELIEATKLSGCDRIKQITRFVGSNLGFLLREPKGVYQMAQQQSKNSIVRSLMAALTKDSLPMPLMENLHESDFDDPCEITLYGHTETIRCCDFSPKGDLILSSSDDQTMRIWDATTGAELVTVTSLPEPIFPDPSEGQTLMLHPVNPCCFSRTGETIASGTELGAVMLWDKTGVQIHKTETGNKAVSYIQFSPDNRHVATAFKNSVLSVWTSDDLSHVATVNFQWSELTGLDYSWDGKKLAVMALRGLILLDTAGYVVKSTNKGACYQNLCCTFHPSGNQVMSGGDDSCVSFWDGNSGSYQTRLKQHTAWIWSIRFTKDGNYMFTCSSDRSMKVWNQSNGSWNVIATVGGHSHRFSMVSIEAETESKLVTSSLDRSLKVWDVATLRRGEVPPVGGSHYLACKISPDGKYLATAQGWAKGVSVLDAQAYDNDVIVTSANHKGFIKTVQFTPSGTSLVVLDHGHSGGFEYGAEKNARVEILHLSQNRSSYLEVEAPTTFSAGPDVIIVGTFSGTIHAINAETFKEITYWDSGAQGQITRVGYSSTNKMVAAGFSIMCRVYQLSGGRADHLKDCNIHDSDIQALTFSPDGHFLVVGVGSGKLYIWDTSKKDIPLFKLATDHASYIKDIEFSTTGKFVVTSAGLSMRVWDVQNGFKLQCTYYAPVNCASFLNDTTVIAGEATGNRKYLKFR